MTQTLEKILRDATYATRHPDKTAKQRLDQATQAIRQAIKEIIGEYERIAVIELYRGEPVTADYTRNRLRSEQLGRAMKFIEGEK